MKQVADAYFKIRNTLRFVLGNLHGFTPDGSGDGLALEAVPDDPLDAWAMARLRRYVNEVVGAYERYDFRTVFHRSVELCSQELSAFYLDVTKDRLYCDQEGSARRRSCQRTLYAIGSQMMAALAPILAFTADEAFRLLPGGEGRSVFAAGTLRAIATQANDVAWLAAAEALFSARGTSSGIMLCQVGMIMAVPIPRNRVSVSRLQALISPVSVSVPMVMATMHMQMLAVIR
jgi:isoleucyl-tRNA synthetase